METTFKEVKIGETFKSHNGVLTMVKRSPKTATDKTAPWNVFGYNPDEKVEVESKVKHLYCIVAKGSPISGFDTRFQLIRFAGEARYVKLFPSEKAATKWASRYAGAGYGLDEFKVLPWMQFLLERPEFAEKA